MRVLLYWLGLVDLVWTLDSVGSHRVRLRIVRFRPDGTRYAYKINGPLLGDTPCQLCDDGTVAKGSYMCHWFPYNPRTLHHGRPQDPHRVASHGFTMWKPRA